MPRPTSLPPEFEGRPFSVDEALRAGVGETRLLGPDLLRPFQGVRTSEEGDGSTIERCRAYSARMTGGQAFSHETAAQLWGMPLPAWVERDARLHVSTFDDSNRPRLRGVVGHQLTNPAMRLTTRHGLRVLDPATVWLQLAPRLFRDDLVAAADHLVLTPRRQLEDDRRPHVPLDRLADRARRFRGRGRRNALDAIPHVRDGAESPRETALRLALVRAHLPEPALNLAVCDADGIRIGYGDLVYPEYKVLVEYEGEQHRLDAGQFFGDIERHEAFVRAGWIHLRESKVTPPSGPRSTPARTRDALSSRGWASPLLATRQKPA